MAMDTLDLVERRLLTCLASAPSEVLAAISDGTSEEDFSTSPHREIFRALCTLVSKNAPITLANVRDHTTHHPAAKEVFDSEPEIGNRRHLTELILEQAEQRRVRATLKKVTQMADQSSIPWKQLKPELAQIVTNVLSAAGRTGPMNWDSICEETRKLILGSGDQGIGSPFPLWDKKAGKLSPGDLCVLAARPGKGKSALAAQFVSSCLNNGVEPVVFTYEMTEAQVLDRILTQVAGGRSPEDRLRELERFCSFPLLGHRVARSISQIEARAKLAAKGDGRARIIIIDYLQLIEAPDSSAPREQQVAAVSRRLKLLALELRVPVLLLAQLNRASEIERREPLPSDLRESGAIEQDADAIWFLHQKEFPKGSGNTAYQLIQAKKRSGRSGIWMPLNFNAEAVRFEAPPSFTEGS